MTRSENSPASNRLLAALPAAVRQVISAAGEVVELQTGALIYGAGAPLDDVYFPVRSCVALVLRSPTSGLGTEVAVVGREGMVGTSPLLGVAVSPQNHLVQCGGSAFRMRTSSLLRELKRSRALRLHLNRYLYVVMHQMAQTAFCTRFHVIEQRFAGWLLMTQDRVGSREFSATHEFIASLFGVRRVGITHAALALHKSGLIRYERGRITIIDRRGLLARTCYCYSAGVHLYDETLGGAPSHTRGMSSPRPSERWTARAV